MSCSESGVVLHLFPDLCLLTFCLKTNVWSFCEWPLNTLFDFFSILTADITSSYTDCFGCVNNSDFFLDYRYDVGVGVQGK